VFNLSVADIPEYFANGILVHNCSDAALYAWRYAWNHLSKPEELAPQPGTEAEALVLMAARRRQATLRAQDDA